MFQGKNEQGMAHVAAAFAKQNDRKKIIAYPKEPFDENTKPYIKAEWNEKGKEIYRNNKMAAK